MMVEASGSCPDCPMVLPVSIIKLVNFCFATVKIVDTYMVEYTTMKITTMIGAAILFVSSVALAHDLTYLGPIKANETKNVKVELPTGKLTIEVTSSSPETRFNCQFQSGYGGVVFEQTNTDKCIGKTVTQSDTSLTVSVKNLGKDSDYKIWVHD